MKKTLKRTLAIVMAVAMLFALSVTAFAYDNQGYIEVIICNNDEVLFDDYLTAAQITGYLTAGSNHLYNLPGGNTTVYYPTTLTAADALIAAYIMDSGVNYDATSYDYTWYGILDPNNDWAQVTINNVPVYGLFFTKFWNLASDNGNYYLINYDPNTGIYTYEWRGNSWSFAINGQGYADLYASDYALDGTSPVITSVELTYMTIVSDPIIRNTPIPGAVTNP